MIEGDAWTEIGCNSCGIRFRAYSDKGHYGMCVRKWNRRALP